MGAQPHKTSPPNTPPIRTTHHQRSNKNPRGRKHGTGDQHLTVVVVAHARIHRIHNLRTTGRGGDTYRLIHNRARRSRVHTLRRHTRSGVTGCAGPTSSGLHVGHRPILLNKKGPPTTITRSCGIPEARPHQLVLRHTSRHTRHINGGASRRQHPPTIRASIGRRTSTNSSSQTNHSTSSSTHHVTHINHPLELAPHTGAHY